MRTWSKVPYRCRVCRKRFYWFDSRLAKRRADAQEARAAAREAVVDVMDGTIEELPASRRSGVKLIVRLKLTGSFARFASRSFASA